jgi:hypothetical protein
MWVMPLPVWRILRLLFTVLVSTKLKIDFKVISCMLFHKKVVAILRKVSQVKAEHSRGEINWHPTVFYKIQLVTVISKDTFTLWILVWACLFGKTFINQNISKHITSIYMEVSNNLFSLLYDELVQRGNWPVPPQNGTDVSHKGSEWNNCAYHLVTMSQQKPQSLRAAMQSLDIYHHPFLQKQATKIS